MKKMSYYVTFITIFILLCTHVSAATTVIITADDGVRFRSAPTTDSTYNGYFYTGKELTYLGSANGKGCNKPWFKVSNNGQVGYVCSEWAILKTTDDGNIDISEYPEYTNYLRGLGFPDTYIPYLINLHKKHPSWDFTVFKSELTFDKIVSIEYDGHSKGWSLIEDTGRYYDGYKSTDSWSYNYLTDTFNTNFEGGGSRWYAPNKQTISYYLDPRNFLNEKQIFMFESLSYNSKYHTRSGVESMLKGSFMENAKADNDGHTFTDAFMDAAEKYKVSPYFLISRVIQEVGIKGSTIVSGTVKNYEGYYNFYNINAYGNSSSETINNGLAYAKKQGWNTKYKAILGGAYFLTKEYISQGQNTLYLEKWDLFGPMYGNHQYMQNIQAPSTESIKTYNGYNNISKIDSSFIFSIPVFKSMPDKTSLPNSGNPNNYLSSLSVNGNYLFKTATTNTTFNVNLSSSTSSITISATKVSSKSTISGTGSVAINSTKQAVKVVVTAENGATRTYTINVTKNSNTSIDIGEILKNANIKNDGTYTFGFKVGTNITDIINQITNKESLAKVTWFNSSGKQKTSGIVASGDKINIKTDREEKNYIVIIYGDVNGDGKINASDYVAIKHDIMDIKKLSTQEKYYADANKDGKINASDYVAIKNDIMDVKKIVQ